VGLVAGPGANAATCRGMNGVEVLELRSFEGAMDSLTESNDGGASSGELEYLNEDFRLKRPAIVPVLKEVHEGDRGRVDPAGAERGMQSASRQAAVRQLTPMARARRERRSPTKTRWDTRWLAEAQDRTPGAAEEPAYEGEQRQTFAWRMVARRPNWPFWRIGAVRPTERHGTSTR
jgi:hypothetical protein